MVGWVLSRSKYASGKLTTMGIWGSSTGEVCSPRVAVGVRVGAGGASSAAPQPTTARAAMRRVIIRLRLVMIGCPAPSSIGYPLAHGDDDPPRERARCARADGDRRDSS